jgi:hypothetical protein
MRRLAVVVGAVAILGAGGVAFAQTTGDERIYACVNNGDGSVRVTAGPDAVCPKNWSPLSWSQRGPRGEQGLPGAKGDPGEKGDRGEPGPGGVKIVLASRTVTVPPATVTPIYRTECVRFLLGQCLEHEQVFDHNEINHGTVSSTATCPQGTQSMGDGDANGVTPGVNVSSSERVGYTGWRATFSNSWQSEATARVEVRCVEVAEVTTVAL